jgi:hypothetical protein
MTIMKKLAIALMLAAMAVSPALAQSFSPGYGTGNVASDPNHPGQPFEYQPTDRTASHWQANSEGGFNATASAEEREWKHQRAHD